MVVSSDKTSLFEFTAMGSPCRLHLYLTPDQLYVAQAAQEKVISLEKKYSRYRDDSVLTQINTSAGPVTVDDETAALLNYSSIAYETSAGLFDITSGVLRRAWDFRSSKLPAQNQIDALLPLIGWDKVEWDGETIKLPEGMEIDFGGVVKEYAADAVASYCLSQGVRHGLVDLGGDICAIGPHPDGRPWEIGVRNPSQPESAIAAISLHKGGVATSGNYERFMVVDGKHYGHILNPLTGWPVSGLASVSVQADECIIAGTASTVALLKGPDGAEDWLTDLGLPHLVISSLGDPPGQK